MGGAQQLPAFPAPCIGALIIPTLASLLAHGFSPEFGVYGLVIGVVVGAALHLQIQLIGLWWVARRYYPVLGLGDANVREVVALWPPGCSVCSGAAPFWSTPFWPPDDGRQPFGAELRVVDMLLPQGIVAQAVATAAFPTFAALEASGRMGELRRLVSSTLRGVLFLTIPAGAGCWSGAPP